MQSIGYSEFCFLLFEGAFQIILFMLEVPQDAICISEFLLGEIMAFIEYIGNLKCKGSR